LRQEFHKQDAFSVPKHCTWSCELRWSVWIFSLLVMMCASIPWTAASIQGLHATPMSRPLWLCGSRSHFLVHYIVSERSMHWPAVSFCVHP
jgi:hypothetical protein